MTHRNTALDIARQMIAHLDECNRVGKFSSIGEDHIRLICTALIATPVAEPVARRLHQWEALYQHGGHYPDGKQCKVCGLFDVAGTPVANCAGVRVATPVADEGVTEEDKNAAARLNGYADWRLYEAVPQNTPEWMSLCARDFSEHRLSSANPARLLALEEAAKVADRGGWPKGLMAGSWGNPLTTSRRIAKAIRALAGKDES